MLPTDFPMKPRHVGALLGLALPFCATIQLPCPGLTLSAPSSRTSFIEAFQLHDFLGVVSANSVVLNPGIRIPGEL